MSITNADGSITPPPFPVLTWLWNSIKVAGITALMIVVLSTTCAYAFARLRFRGKSTILQGMLIFQMFPAVLALVAIYALFNKIGDYIPWLGLNTHGGLILAYMGALPCTSGPSRATSRPSTPPWRRRRPSMALLRGRRSA